MVIDYENMMGGLTLPDPNDHHVLAAARICQAQVIVTFNLKDFPSETLSKYGIEAQHPDVFLRSQAELVLPQFLECVKAIRTRLKNPPLSSEEYLISLASAKLIKTASFLSDFAGLI